MLHRGQLNEKQEKWFQNRLLRSKSVHSGCNNAHLQTRHFNSHIRFLDIRSGEEIVPIPEPALIIYDGECIYCQNYVRFVQLREAVGPVELLDARSGDPRIARYWREGFDLNEGMVFVHGGTVHHGADAVNVLALLSSDRTALSKLNARLFSRPTVARLLYPLLKLGRRATLMARGRQMMRRP